MSRYIDADWLLNFFEPYPNDYQIPLGSLRACVDDAPNIDIGPKRGEWQYVYKGKWMFRRCSFCEWTQTYDDSKYIGYRYNFCPNCGCAMT